MVRVKLSKTTINTKCWLLEMDFSQILAEFAEKMSLAKNPPEKMRLAENPPKESVSRPNILKKFGWVVYASISSYRNFKY